MQRTLGWIGLCLLAVSLAACRGNKSNEDGNDDVRAEGKGTMSVNQSSYGKTADGQEVIVYTLTNKNGLVAKVMNYGATWMEMHVPDRDGKMVLRLKVDGDKLVGELKAEGGPHEMSGKMTLSKVK